VAARPRGPPASRLWVSVRSVQLSVAGSCLGEDEGLRAAPFRLEGSEPVQGGRPWVCLGWSVGEIGKSASGEDRGCEAVEREMLRGDGSSWVCWERWGKRRDGWWERLRVCVDGRLWDQKLEMAGLGLAIGKRRRKSPGGFGSLFFTRQGEAGCCCGEDNSRFRVFLLFPYFILKLPSLNIPFLWIFPFFYYGWRFIYIKNLYTWYLKKYYNNYCRDCLL
jgi:hypothetical protein